MTLALYAPHSPRSLVISSIPERSTVARGVSSGWSTVACRANVLSTSVIALAYGRDASARSCAFAIRLVATSSCALVIFLVDLTERIRRRST